MKYFIIPIVALVILSNIAQAEKNYRSTDSLFGVDLQWYEQKKSRGFIKKFLTKNRVRLQSTLDPDCLYKKVGNTLCGKKIDKKLLAEVEAEAFTLKKETNGLFDPNRKKQRDFSGLSQGFVIDQLIASGKKGWAINFSGDIYVSDPIQLGFRPYIADPMLDQAPFATVEMKRGWMITSDLNKNIKLKKGLTPKQRIKRIVLFAQPDFKGARLDAWATSIVTGGIPQLRSLLALKKYRNKWGYVYFNINDKAVCSANLECDIKRNTKRSVKVLF